MKKSLTWIAAVLILFTACSLENTPDSGNQSQSKTITNQFLSGIWSVSPDDAQDMASFYVQFYSDGTWKRLWQYAGDVTYYVADTGTYIANDTLILLVHKAERHYFYQNNILRVACSFDYANIYPDQYPYQGFEVFYISKDSIAASYWEYNYNFRRLQELPDSWDPRFFEPEKTVSEASLIGVWDQVNHFSQTATPSEFHFNWWYYDYPNYAGIELLPNGKVQMPFLIAFLLKDKLIYDGIIPDTQEVSVADDDCSWAMDNNSITLTCSKYSIFNGDSDVEYPLTPTFTANLSINSFTETFLILYWDFNETYYALTPGTSTPKAPKKVSTRSQYLISRKK